MQKFLPCMGTFCAAMLMLSAAAFAHCTMVSSINYIGDNNVPQSTTPTVTDIHTVITGKALSTDDPEWRVTDLTKGNSGTFNSIRYLTQDGSAWSAKWHCEHKDPRVQAPITGIHCWLEHERLNGADNHPADGIVYLDDQRRPMMASIPIVNTWPASPQFCVQPWKPGMLPSWRDH